MKTTLLSMFFSSLILSAQAALITFTDTQPTTNVILANTVTVNASIQVRNIGTNATNNTRWVGTGFKASSNTSLDKVTFFIWNDAVTSTALGAEMTISIVSLASLSASPSAPYSPLYSETANVPATYLSENYITFDLATPYSLTANSYYGVMVSFSSNANSRGINLNQSGSSTGGNATTGIGDLFYTADLGATYTNTTSPLNFVLQTVPEPATLALFAGAGGVCALGLARMRRKTER